MFNLFSLNKLFFDVHIVVPFNLSQMRKIITVGDDIVRGDFVVGPLSLWATLSWFVMSGSFSTATF